MSVHVYIDCTTVRLLIYIGFCHGNGMWISRIVCTTTHKRKLFVSLCVSLLETLLVWNCSSGLDRSFVNTTISKQNCTVMNPYLCAACAIQHSTFAMDMCTNSASRL